MSQPRVAVLGAGIIGLATAVRAIESVPGVDITVVSSEFTPNTTGDGSAGYVYPYLIGSASNDTIRRWCQETFGFLLKLLSSSESEKCGVGLLSGYRLSDTAMDDCACSDILLDYRALTAKELQMFPVKYRYGMFVTSLYAECTKLLPYLMERFKSQGGKVQQKKVLKLTELETDFDIIVNCVGIEARNIVPDLEVFPIRGQVIKVKAPWVKHVLFSKDHYIIPNSDTVTLGGTRQEGNWNRTVDLDDRRHIWEGCCKLVPSLQHAEVIKEWVGLRPGRSCPRIERDQIVVSGNRKIEVIHNYGHGGSGVTLSWGCAGDACKLLNEALLSVKMKSKL